MEILLALAAAVSYGVSDFAGGVLTRPAHVFVVLLLSQLVSFALCSGGRGVVKGRRLVAGGGLGGGGRPGRRGGHVPALPGAGHRPHERRRRAGGRPAAALRLALRGVEKFLTPLNAWSAEQKRDVGTLPSPPASRRSPPSSRRRDRAGYSPVLLLALPALGGSKRTTAGIMW
jgi:hypothetical protein